MKLNMEPIKNWFGFSRRERRSSFTLLIIIAVILGIRYTIPSGITTIEDITGTFSASDRTLKDSIVSGKYLADNNTDGSRSYYKKPYAEGAGSAPKQAFNVQPQK